MQADIATHPLRSSIIFFRFLSGIFARCRACLSTTLLSRLFATDINMSSQVNLFRKLPAELRQQIFELALLPLPASEPHHELIVQKMPGLIKALRFEKDLYYEALYFFYRYNRLYFTTYNFEAFSPKDVAKVTYIQHLGVNLASPQDNKLPLFVQTADTFITAATKLETIHINLHESRGGFGDAATFMGRLRPSLTNLKSLTLNVTLEGMGLWIEPGEEQKVYTSRRKIQQYRDRRAKLDGLVRKVIENINPLFKEERQRKFFVVSEGTRNVNYKVIERWVWESKKSE